GRLRRHAAGVYEDGDALSLGHELVQELQPLGLQFVGQHIDPGEIAAGAGEAGDETEPGRVFVGTVVVAALAAIAAGGPPEVTITVACRASSLAISGRRSTRSSAQR